MKRSEDYGWLTTAEAASILGRSPHTVGDLARAGRLPWMRCGRQLLVSAGAVRERAAQAAQWVVVHPCCRDGRLLGDRHPARGAAR
jgi:excisionase family DNA binding protein